MPHAAVWAAITGLLALVPFLGYVAVAALTLRLAITAAPPLFSLGPGCFVLFCGDKIVRPVVAGEGTHLRFVWFLMACLGGFEVLGLVGLVIGPVVLTLTRELWEQRVRDLALAKRHGSNVTDRPWRVTTLNVARELVIHAVVEPRAWLPSDNAAHLKSNTSKLKLNRSRQRPTK